MQGSRASATKALTHFAKNNPVLAPRELISIYKSEISPRTPVIQSSDYIKQFHENLHIKEDN